METDTESSGSSLSFSSILSDYDVLLAEIDELKRRLEALEVLQKQDADEAVGMIASMDEAIEKLQDDTEHHKHLINRLRVADLLN